MKTLTIIRGCPNAGKTTFAEYMNKFNENMAICSADHYFEDPETGEYKFDASKLKEAHAACQQHAESEMQMGNDVVISNTNSQDWEMKYYEDLAEKYSYRVFHIIVENRHGNKNNHEVPDIVVEKMKKRFSISL
jgi:predicted kinase